MKEWKDLTNDELIKVYDDAYEHATDNIYDICSQHFRNCADWEIGYSQNEHFTVTDDRKFIDALANCGLTEEQERLAKHWIAFNAYDMTGDHSRKYYDCIEAYMDYCIDVLENSIFQMLHDEWAVYDDDKELQEYYECNAERFNFSEADREDIIYKVICRFFAVSGELPDASCYDLRKLAKMLDKTV